jgi:hypothetical protein
MARDDEAQQATPIPPPEFPHAPPPSWPTSPHGTHNGLGVNPPAPMMPGDRSGDERRTPTPARAGGIAKPGSTATLGF